MTWRDSLWEEREIGGRKKDYNMENSYKHGMTLPRRGAAGQQGEMFGIWAQKELVREAHLRITLGLVVCCIEHSGEGKTVHRDQLDGNNVWRHEARHALR